VPQTTDRRRLATLTLAQKGLNLDTTIAELRGQGDGWRVIADRLREEHGVDVYWTTLMRWYASEDAAA
jgi:intein-encoded DNA endonuclease-like protein